MNTKTAILQESSTSMHEAWFDEFIAHIRTHQLQLETGTADTELQQLYSMVINGHFDELLLLNKQAANKQYIKKVIVDYLTGMQKNAFTKMAFDLDDSEVLVWVEIKNDDEESENFLLLKEASVNGKFHDIGYDLTTTIVEERDNLSIPNHYTIFKG